VKLSLRVLIIGVALVLLAGCTSSATTPAGGSSSSALAPKGPVNLRMTIWTANSGHLALLNSIADAYKKTDPRVGKITFDTLPYDQYSTVLTTQLAGGNPPDLGWIFERDAPEFISRGVLADVGPYLRSVPGYDLNDLLPSAMKLWTNGNSIYGYPFSTSPYAIFYNANLFASSGIQTPDQLLSAGQWTWTNLAKAAKTIAEKNPGKFGYTIQNFDYTNWVNLSEIWRGFGADPWDAAGTQCTMANKPMVDALTFYHSMVYNDKSVPGPGQMADFFSGQVGMTSTQISSAQLLKTATFKWGVVPLPSGPAGNAQVIGQAGLAVFASGKHKDVAEDFLAFMTNQANAKKLAEYFPPPRKSLLTATTLAQANPLLSAQQLQTVVIDSIDNGRVEPAHQNFAQINDAVQAALAPLWSPNANVANVVQATCTALQPLLAH
jgi:multiple sugar transport system substrate-binding protein